MNFDVDWQPGALRELAAIWNAALDGDRVTAASNQIDRLLERDPLGVGESREGSYRVLFVAPLGVTYEVDQPGRAVSVVRAWRY